MEIVLRLIAHGKWYVMDIWNIADASVVIISTVLNLVVFKLFPKLQFYFMLRNVGIH